MASKLRWLIDECRWLMQMIRHQRYGMNIFFKTRRTDDHDN